MISTTTTTMIMMRWKAPIAFDDGNLFWRGTAVYSQILVLSECILSAWLNRHLPCIWDAHLSLFSSLFPNPFLSPRMEGRWRGGGRGEG